MIAMKADGNLVLKLEQTVINKEDGEHFQPEPKTDVKRDREDEFEEEGFEVTLSRPAARQKQSHPKEMIDVTGDNRVA